MAITNANTFSTDRGSAVLRSATVDQASPLTVKLDGQAGISADRLASYTPVLNDVVAVMSKPLYDPSGKPGVLVLGVVA
jgi:hypothetical protein